MNWTRKHSLLTATMAIAIAVSQAHATFQYDLRFAPGQTGETDPHNVTLNASSPSTYTVQVWGQITGDTIFNNDAWNDGVVSMESNQGAAAAFNSGGVISAQMGIHVSSPSAAGTPGNITNDGITDWGTASTTTFQQYSAWRGGLPPGYIGGTPDAESEQVNANTWEVLIVTYVIAVGDVASGNGTTYFDLLAPPQIKSGVPTQNTLLAYIDDPLVPSGGFTVGAPDNQKPYLVSSFSIIGDLTFTTGSGDPSSDSPDSVPEPASLTLLALGGLTLATRRRRQA